jgi:hypothetical protein
MKAVLLALAIAVPGTAGAHDWYTGLTQNGSDCCSGHDCGEVPSDRVACRYGLCWITLKPGDHLMMPVGGKLLFTRKPGFSPDGGTHVCIHKGIPTCLFVGGQS